MGLGPTIVKQSTTRSVFLIKCCFTFFGFVLEFCSTHCRGRQKKRQQSPTRHHVGIENMLRVCSGLGLLSEIDKVFCFSVLFYLILVTPPPPPLVWHSKKGRVSFFFSCILAHRRILFDSSIYARASVARIEVSLVSRPRALEWAFPPLEG